MRAFAARKVVSFALETSLRPQRKDRLAALTHKTTSRVSTIAPGGSERLDTRAQGAAAGQVRLSNRMTGPATTNAASWSAAMGAAQERSCGDMFDLAEFARVAARCHLCAPADIALSPPRLWPAPSHCITLHMVHVSGGG
ncbi:hypothetical protein GCM10018962_24040 [Dactylosporangium matsuzakiense]|uniref:Uncharacterized protein n=1 Tax=Dactylosporangium matsuzakiense TaxID=53360 RepID=A0A9W6KW50_9ACTN|nr:hypothetical protein GCM10017581_092420 [Dactylosporangium matsuzakiense]